MSDQKKDSQHHHHEQPPPQYGTFQGVANYPPPQPAMGFPQPIPPPGLTGIPQSSQPGPYYDRGYQSVPGYAVVQGRPVREHHHRLPCCGIGFGWFLFITGFFLAGIPWYIAAFLLLCSTYDPREKPGYTLSAIAAVLATIAIIFGLTKIDFD